MATQTNETLKAAGAKAQELNEKGSEAASTLAHKAMQASGRLSEKAAQTGSRIGDKIEEVTTKLRESLPDDGRLAATADSVVHGLERTGQYLRDANLRSVGSELQSVVRRHPVQASLVGLGLGILLGRALVNRSSARV